jgi:hypothetical protein
VGTYTVKIWIEDEAGEGDEETVTFTVLNVNDPPVLDFITDLMAFEDEVFSFTATASDIDVGDSFTFSDNSTLFDIDVNTGAISFTPANENVGVHVINISVTDENGGIDYQEIVIIVENINDPPVISDTVKSELSQDIELHVGDSFTYTIVVDDADADDHLTFSDDSDLFDIHPTTGEILFSPTSRDAGTHTATITVTDSEGEEDHINLTFDITDEKGEQGNLVLLMLLLIIPIIVIVLFIVLIILKGKKKGDPPVAEPVELSEFEALAENEEEMIFTSMVPTQEDPAQQEPGIPPVQ